MLVEVKTLVIIGDVQRVILISSLSILARHVTINALIEVATILFRVATFCELFGVFSGAVEIYLIRVAFAECFIPIHWSIIATAVRLEPLSKIDFIVIWLE
jgi:hypothetical protein